MKHYVKKTIAFFLTLCLMAAAIPTAMAAQNGARKTNFFPHDLYHTDLDFSEIEYRHIDLEQILSEIETVRGLLDDAANAAEVERLFWEITDERIELATMKNLVEISTDLDVNDEEAAEEFSYCSVSLVSLDDARRMLVRDILKSPCAGFLEKILDEDQIKQYRDYEAMDKKLLDLVAQENALVAEYMSASVAPAHGEYNGKEWTMETVAAAYIAGEIDVEDITAIQLAMDAAKNKELGEIYLKMVKVRKDIAKMYGYDYYPDYAYKEIYQRDYTPAEVKKLYAGVKEYIVPIYEQLREKNDENRAENKDLFNSDYMGENGEELLDLLEPYIGRFSSEMLEAITYMREHHFYDTTRGDSKASSLYASDLPSYGVPFFFKQPFDTIQDITGSVHELGHYNNFFYNPQNSKQIEFLDECYDTQEVHSQSFELLFTHFYPEIFGGDDEAAMVEIYVHYAILDSIVTGAMYDELQQYAYSTDNLTLKKLNEKYYELCGEYGIETRSQDGEAYGWVNVSHTFDQPCYYISYCTSAAGAYEFWLESQDDYFGAADQYLKFVALDPTLGFQKSFEAVGMSNPLSEGYLKELSEMLYEKLDIEDPAEKAGTFTDVDEDKYYYDAVMWAYENGVTTGTGDGSTFSPDRGCTRAQFVTFLWRAAKKPDPTSTENKFSDVSAATHADYYQAILWAYEQEITTGSGDGTTFSPDEVVTRAQAVTFMHRYAKLADIATETGTEDFDDVTNEGAMTYYYDAIGWAAANGITNGNSTTANTFGPMEKCNRAMMVTFLHRLFTDATA